MAFGEWGCWPSTANHCRMTFDFFLWHPKFSFSRLRAMGRSVWSLEHYPEALTCCHTSRITSFVFCWSMCGPLPSYFKWEGFQQRHPTDGGGGCSKGTRVFSCCLSGNTILESQKKEMRVVLRMVGAVWGFLSLKAAPDFLTSQDPNVWVLWAKLQSVQAKLQKCTCFQCGSDWFLTRKRECRGSSTSASNPRTPAPSWRGLCWDFSFL